MATLRRGVLCLPFLLLTVLQQPSCTPRGKPTREVRVLTDRTASHLDNLFKHYEKATGTRIVTNYVGDGLLARLQSRPKEADVVVTANADLLEVAKQRKLLTPHWSQPVVKNVPAAFRDPQHHYTVLSFRARALFYAKGRVAPKDLSSYRDLTRGAWKGRICVRSGFHPYNVSWLSQMAATQGIDEARIFIKGLRKNLARPPRGNDREQVRGLLSGECDVAIANSYYMGIMLGRDDQKAWAEASAVFFPDQNEGGTYVLRSGAALTTAKGNADAGNELLGFLTGEFAQRYFSEALFEYPVNAAVPPAAANAALGKEQGIRGGAFKIKVVPLAEGARYRQAVLDLLTEANFDGS